MKNEVSPGETLRPLLLKRDWWALSLPLYHSAARKRRL